MLAVVDVSVRFNEQVAVLDHVSIDVAAGQVVALLGPSGSGKSTLLRVIAGIIAPDSGRVLIDGVDVTHVATHRRSVGMVFQDEQLFPHLSVADNVGFGLKMAGVGKVERARRASDLLRTVGLDGFDRRRIHGLSGGERKRVALARSLAPSPRLLLLDEPLSGLDTDLHDRLAADVAHILHDTNTTALWVTHDRDEANTVADRVMAIDELAQPDRR